MSLIYVDCDPCSISLHHDPLLSVILHFALESLKDWTIVKLVSKQWNACCNLRDILQFVCVQAKNYTDQQCSCVASLQGIRILSITDSTVTDAGVHSLSQMTDLMSLNLSGNSHITDIGVQYLSAMTGLTSLNLRGIRNITDIGLQFLSFCKTLQFLNVCCCTRITDVGLQSIIVLSSLRSLDISVCCTITDHGLLSLSFLTGLKSLTVCSWSYITLSGLTQLQTALPFLQIHMKNLES
jgi:hypothetical protein